MVVAVAVAALGGGLLLAGVVRAGSLIGLLPAVPLWATWSVMVLADVDEAVVGVFALAVSLSLLGAAWVGAGNAGLTWLAWPAAVGGYGAFALLVPETYPTVLEAWTLPAALLLAVAGVVSCRGRETSSLEMVAPALSVALLPSAFATWLSPWVSDVSGEATEHVVRLVVVLVVGGVLMVVGARQHAPGVLLPASAAVLVAGTAQLWTGLATLPRWVALALVGMLLVLAGARFEWVRDEGRRARTGCSRWADRGPSGVPSERDELAWSGPWSSTPTCTADSSHPTARTSLSCATSRRGGGRLTCWSRAQRRGVVATVTFCLGGSRWANIARPGEAEFRMLAVAPIVQGHGLGGLLVRACLDRAAAAGVTTTVISTEPEMVVAQRMYERLGFVRSPERDWAPRPGIDLITYRYDAPLAPAR